MSDDSRADLRVCPFFNAATNPDNPGLRGPPVPLTGRIRVSHVHRAILDAGAPRWLALFLGPISLLANPLRRLPRNVLRRSFQAEGVAGSPALKSGGNSGILRADGPGVYSPTMLERLLTRWGETRSVGGVPTRGLPRSNVWTMVKANQAELDGNPIFGTVSLGEFLALFLVFGRTDDDGGRFLTEADLRDLYEYRRYPGSAESAE